MEDVGDGEPRQAELRLEQREVKRLIHEALSKKSFPPVVQHPEAIRGDVLLSSLFQWPVVVWVPEVKEYKQRTVEDVDSKSHPLYIKYQCAGDHKSCFSTFGISKRLMELVHEGMTSPHGLSRTLRLVNPTYLAPTPPTVAQYCSQQTPVGAETLSAAWMQSTNIYSALCEQIMSSLDVKRVLRIDHSVKFCKRLKLRPPEEMEARFVTALQDVALTDISCSEQEWQGSVDSNLKQVKRGDLYVENNVFSEGGGKDHNLKVGSSYGRNPPLQHADILTLAQTAMLCRGVVADSPQLEYVSRLVSKPLQQPAYRSATALDFGFDQWQQMFEGTNIDAQALESSLQRSHQHSTTIRELLAKQITFTESGKLPRVAFFNSLCLNELDYEAAAGFSSEEHALPRQVLVEQKAAGQSWSGCAMVTTIMYNIVVSSNSNHKLRLKRRSFITLSAKIDGFTAKSRPEPSTIRDRKLFRFVRSAPCDANTAREKELQAQLFTALRKLSDIRKKRQVFVMVYDFACCVCAGIHPKSQPFLLSRWDNLKQQENYGANLKIKLKLTPEILASIRSTTSHRDKSQPVLAEQPSGAAQQAPQGTAEELLQSSDSTSLPAPPTFATADGTPDVSLSYRDSAGNTLPKCSDTARIPQHDGEESAAQATTAPPLQHATITPDHIKMLRELANSIPNSNGKWEYIHTVYTKYYPHLPLSSNALRCRLKDKNPPPKLSTNSNAPLISSRKRRETSCSSCRQRKKCGDLTRNPYCTQPKSNQDSQAESIRLDHYFTQV
ncbi:hypothetical protein PHYSODRAFT_324496 [Phytophthora sojae]|uniref:Uncharacterized protein n=1 Tax=Phytophthora sojae (strain P6497) TaxID=1094619 RepID=G4YYB9_PHYSP|nr:hypothetical protein PHYSODRAFT_324496 [Phytophthora sojae]EGZ23270.1 hypothetical protein PHYSODRAFT_324496 [Phytophthora sojae]|eukprot:XP_009518558.1 hypothetical protein PHYSODRAFT_324496 [Phytophthora sojae]